MVQSAMADRPKLSAKPHAAARDPNRPPVRSATAPRNPKQARPPGANPQSGRPAGQAAAPTARIPPNRPVRPVVPVVPIARAASSAPPAAPAADGLRVSKLITERGLASRREADEWIAAGWVRVGGQPVVLGQRVAPDAVVDIDPRARTEQAQLVTVLLHKPIGYVSGQAEDGHEPAIVLVTPANRWSGDRSGIEFRGSHLRHLAPAGRLDIDSTGMLVLTQDGRVAKRLIGDETRVEKEYLVRVASADGRPLPDTPLARLRHGLVLDGVALRPAQVSWQNEDQLRIVLREGRKRQIRRMCELVGLRVLGLKRVRIGSVPLGPLPPGQWRYLRDDERF
jgi:23S rRNA pseudouridine2604 synthase